MNLEEIAQRIKAPHLCAATDIDPLRQLTEKYPYAQSFSILYLKALSSNNDVRFDDELHQHAYRITDRVRLFELIQEKENESPTEIIIIEEPIQIIEATTEVEIQIDTDEPTIQDLTDPEEEDSVVTETEEENSKQAETVLIEEIHEPMVEEVLTESDESSFSFTIDSDEPEQLGDSSEESNILASEIIAENSTQFEEEEIEFMPDFSIEFDEINEEVQVENLESTNDTEPHIEKQTMEVAIEAIEVQDENQDELEIEILSHAVSSNYSLLNLVKATQEDEIEDEAEIEGKLEVEFDISNSLSERNQFDPLEFKAYSLEKEVNSSSETPKKAFSSWLKSNVNDIPLEREEDSKSKVDQLVNQFIKTEPTITRPEKEILEEEKPKAEFFSPVKKAKQSLDENSLPVSETLAKIFVAQGNFPKAIYAYEQLMVIYPEKKIFFAKQIEELTKKINT